ncbi:MAG: N-6 DNA methylase, partial [Treponema sp.]|nr:N-6 DNA methylase [Treponema sp.]
LLHNLRYEEFSDIYAQTLAYGLFAARLNQSDGQAFTRFLAPSLIPQSNPFLRKFFNHISGIDLDSRITWIVDALAGVFNRVAAEDIKKEFLEANQDPYIHFYETFLAKYDPALRESRGVYYTPLPVVQFIVRAVDDILKTEFNIKNGLADHSKVKGDGGFHRVQILDPAAGTGTFLAAVIEKIYSYFAGNKGAWQGYCADHLIPRINGFEILMASYAMAHFKLDMALKETGFVWNNGSGGDKKRLRVYLANTLEEAPESVPELFMAQWLAREAEEARMVKRDVPVMVVMGNPPYNASTQNKNEWIDGLIADYKKEPWTEEKLREQKLNLDDDYVKFIRYGQMLVEKNKTGILAYINNHSFLDNPTFRGMRWNLMQAFDKIYIMDLHGNTKRKETAPDGSKDENVFDIQIGTSINIFIKTGKKKAGHCADVFHAEFFGRRKAKYDYLIEQTIESIKWNKLAPHEPFYFFVPKDFSSRNEYENGFSVKEMFPVTSPGIKTERDAVTIHFAEQTLQKTIDDFLTLDIGAIRARYNLGKDSRDWKIDWAKKDLAENLSNGKKLTIQYRPFDFRRTFYTGKSKGFIGTPGFKAVKHFMAGENLGLIFLRNMPSFEKWSGVFVTDKPVEFGIGGSFPGNTAPIAPLYLYPEKGDLESVKKRRPNLNDKIVNIIAQKTGLRFTEEKTNAENTFAPVDILDYIYAVLHSPAYREKYKELLKIDFPRVSYPKNAEDFYRLAAIGSILRKLHLMEDVILSDDKASFPVAGSNEIEIVRYEKGKAYINKTQYFDNVPIEAWEFYIGGYQPAQKWLKDRKGRTLVFDEIDHYRKIITALSLTIDIGLV